MVRDRASKGRLTAACFFFGSCAIGGLVRRISYFAGMFTGWVVSTSACRGRSWPCQLTPHDRSDVSIPCQTRPDPSRQTCQTCQLSRPDPSDFVITCQMSRDDTTRRNSKLVLTRHAGRACLARPVNIPAILHPVAFRSWRCSALLHGISTRRGCTTLSAFCLLFFSKVLYLEASGIRYIQSAKKRFQGNCCIHTLTPPCPVPSCITAQNARPEVRWCYNRLGCFFVSRVVMPRPRWVAQSCPILSCPCLAPDKNSRFCETARVWWVACAAAVLPPDKLLEHGTVRPVPRLSVGFLLPDSLLHIFRCARARVCCVFSFCELDRIMQKTRTRPSGAEGMAWSCRRWTRRMTPRSPLKR